MVVWVRGVWWHREVFPQSYNPPPSTISLFMEGGGNPSQRRVEGGGFSRDPLTFSDVSSGELLLDLRDGQKWMEGRVLSRTMACTGPAYVFNKSFIHIRGLYITDELDGWASGKRGGF